MNGTAKQNRNCLNPTDAMGEIEVSCVLLEAGTARHVSSAKLLCKL